MKILYKGYTIQDSRDGRNIIDGVDIYSGAGRWITYKLTLDDAKKAIDKWTGNSVKIERK